MSKQKKILCVHMHICTENSKLYQQIHDYTKCHNISTQICFNSLIENIEQFVKNTKYTVRNSMSDIYFYTRCHKRFNIYQDTLPVYASSY